MYGFDKDFLRWRPYKVAHVEALQTILDVDRPGTPVRKPQGGLVIRGEAVGGDAGCTGARLHRAAASNVSDRDDLDPGGWADPREGAAVELENHVEPAPRWTR